MGRRRQLSRQREMSLSSILRFAVGILMFLPIGGAASGVLGESITIDFTKPEDAAAKAEWIEDEKINLSDTGLGWDEDPTVSIDGWIKSKPIALGSSWRPATAVHIRVEIDPDPLEIQLPNGQIYIPSPGSVFARYSPDRKHWSTWQYLEKTELHLPTGVRNHERSFSGRIHVPNIARENYIPLRQQYSRMNVPWRSDEEATVRWILKDQPDFFAHQLPFIGYLEIRFETGFYGGRRIEKMKIDLSYSVSGLHLPPKDGNYRSGPWQFEAE